MAKLSSQRIRSILERGDQAPTAHARGRALEDLIVHIMAKIPGVRLEDRDFIAAGGSEELDVVFWNDRLPSALHFLPNVLLFECKNWNHPVDSAAVSFFLEKLRARHLEYGFLIAANGITGDENELTAAHNHVNRFFTRDRCGLLIFDRQEIQALQNTTQLIRLIQHKIALLVMKAR